MGNQRSFHWAWVILATVFVDLFINYSVRMGYGVLLPEMISTLGFTRTETASIYNSYLFAYIAVTPFSGWELASSSWAPSKSSGPPASSMRLLALAPRACGLPC